MKRFVCLGLSWLLGVGAFYDWGGAAAKGVHELKRGHPREAAGLLLDGRRELPRSAAVSYDRAIALERAGQPDSAAAEYYSTFTSPSLQGDPARSSAAYNLGNDALRAGRFGDAIRSYRESLRTDPTRSDAKKNLEEAIRRARHETPKQPNPNGGGGGSQQPKAKEPRPSSPPGSPPPGSKGERPPQSGKEPPPDLGGSNPSRAEAEHWLDALEAERKASRLRDRGGSERETGQRDW